ncbi:MAG: TlpA family protein disulfide reductase [Moraxellaceae bacterium]|nr:TlpA family protein disulfide reductase [Pseudobdellovibrionaceae bacterium]
MKIRLAFLFLLIFIASIFAVFYFKNYFFIQTPENYTEKQKLSAQIVIDVIRDKSIQLYDYEGKLFERSLINRLTEEKNITRVFHFWASWCDPCAIELPELISYAKKIEVEKTRDRGVQIYLVSVDSEIDGLNKFTQIFPEILSNHFIQIWDRNNTLSRRFGVDKLPMTIFILPNGKLEIHEGVVSWKNLNL